MMPFDRLRMSGMLRVPLDRLSLSGVWLICQFTRSAQAEPEPVEARALTEGPGA